MNRLRKPEMKLECVSEADRGKVAKKARSSLDCSEGDYYIVYNNNLKLLNLVPKKSDPDSMRVFANEYNSMLFELRNFGIDLLVEGSSGFSLIAKASLANSLLNFSGK